MAQRSRAGGALHRSKDLDHFRHHNLGWLLLRVAGDFQHRAQAAFESRGHAGMQPAHSTLLVNLDLAGARPTELAQRAGISKQAVGQLVDDLEELGYVERVGDPEDRRAKHIRFTRAGLELLSEARGVVAEVYAAYAAMIGARELRALRACLDRLVSEIEAEERRGGPALDVQAPGPRVRRARARAGPRRQR